MYYAYKGGELVQQLSKFSKVGVGWASEMAIIVLKWKSETFET